MTESTTGGVYQVESEAWTALSNFMLNTPGLHASNVSLLVSEEIAGLVRSTDKAAAEGEQRRGNLTLGPAQATKKRQEEAEGRHKKWIERADTLHKLFPSYKPWHLAGRIAKERQEDTDYSQRTIYNALKEWWLQTE